MQAATCYYCGFSQVGDGGKMPRHFSNRNYRSSARQMIAAAITLATLTFVSGCSDRDRPMASETVRPTGQQLFMDHCASCHGTEGRGDGPLAPELRVAPANLRLLAQNNDGRFPDRRVHRSIDGRGMPPVHGLPEMPVWGAALRRQASSETQVSAQIILITSYIGTLQD